MVRTLLSLMVLSVSLQGWTQTDAQYRMEIGAGVGLMTYQGDFNGSIFAKPQPSGSLLWRYVFNPRMALKALAGYGQIKGGSASVDTYYPQLEHNPYTFKQTLSYLDVAYEYNFWPYGTGNDYRGAKRFTPFVTAGIGAVYAQGSKSNVFTAQLPIGVGVKYKLGERLNIALEWLTHFSLSDKLDGMADPYEVKSSGLMKNTDGFSVLQATITYSFHAKCRTCHNQDE